MQILSNCIDERRLQMLLSSGIVNTPQVMCPKNLELQKEHRYFAESVEQCPILDDFVHTKLGLSFPWKAYVTLDSTLLSDLVNGLLRGKVESLLCICYA